MILNHSLADHMDRRDYRALPDLPVVVVEGPVGSGKSTLLTRLDAEWRSSVPVVRIALGGLPPGTRPYEIAVFIADELVRRTQMPKRLFPRLFLGVAALQQPALPREPDEAMRTLDQYLRGRTAVLEKVQGVVTAARGVISTVVPDGAAAGAAEAGLAAVGPLTWSLRKQMPAWRWFAAATGSTSGIAGLVEVNRQQHRGPAGQDHVDTVLLRAFRSDLRRAFTRWRHSDRLRHNILLLIDDADYATDGGVRLRFVQDLLAARTAAGPTAGDPLLMVVGSGRRTASGVQDFPFGREVRGPTTRAEVDLAWRPRGTSVAPIHVVSVCDNLPEEPGTPSRVDRWCRSLSAGHYAAYRQLLTVGAELPPGREPNRETLFPRSVAEEIIGLIPWEQSSDLEHDLQILSAICPDDPLADESFIAVLTPSGLSGRGAVAVRTRRELTRRFVSRALWAGPRSTEGAASRPSPSGLHPIFRRALLVRLSHAGPDSARTWDDVFQRLAAARDEASEWHHHYELARTGNVQAAARHLARQLDRVAPRRWLDELDSITSAPRKRDPDASSADEFRFVVALDAALGGNVHDGLDHWERRVADVVAPLWLSRNHRGEPGHEDLLYAAGALEILHAGLCAERTWSETRAEPLRVRANSYRTLRFLDKLV
ncbi:hypothetical protein ACQPWY_28040 [Pseudonocardia xinjiangensis]|uniref:hypothetical protein n=1 Tax=Pseudonocardia xinjiangensis TaxID=75289 RepID=UPI003D91A689